MAAARQQQKGEAFRALHEGEPFVIPNPWDAGSARVLEALGFKAVASTSSGFAFTLGRLDGDVTLDQVVQHAEALDRAIGLPVSIDLEHGYGRGPESVSHAIERVAAAGAVGASIEDNDPSQGISARPDPQDNRPEKEEESQLTHQRGEFSRVRVARGEQTRSPRLRG